MCLAIPMRVVACDGLWATCEGRNGTATIDLTLVGTQPVGTWVSTFLGAARDVITEADARSIESALDALQGALSGDRAAIDAAFADRDREPQLPPHLRPGTPQ